MIFNSTTMWPARPRPLHDESFSSWFSRLAEANFVTPAELFRAATPNASFHGGDLDRHAGHDLPAALARRTGLDIPQIQNLTFSRWCGKVFDEDDGRVKLLWLPPAGRERSHKSFGQQYCPHCLADDPRPYLRASWRLGFVSACPIHRRLLCDRCPGCAEPLQPLKLQRAGRGLSCPRCGVALTTARPAGVPLEYLDFQETMQLAAAEGWIDLPGWGHLHALAYFQLVSLLLRILSSGSYARSLRHLLSQTAQERHEMAQVPLVRSVDLLVPERRVQLLTLVERLLRSWPDNFVAACRKAGVVQGHFMKYGAWMPFVFWEPVTRLLSNSWRRVGDEEMREGAAYLRDRGAAPTLDALRSLFCSKIQLKDEITAPAFPHEEYGKGRYWKLDGVSPEVRQAVRLTAHKEGENVAGWVEKALRSKLRRSESLISSSGTK